MTAILNWIFMNEFTPNTGLSKEFTPNTGLSKAVMDQYASLQQKMK